MMEDIGKSRLDTYIFIKVAVSLLIIGINYIRIPQLFSYPRFFAEEGSLYFSYAYSHSWINNLLTPQHGYYTLYHSVVTSLAKLPTIENAPLVTTSAAFIVQVVVSYYALWGNIPIFDNVIKKSIVALLIPLVSFPHIWLTTIGIHFWLPVITFFILISANNNTPKYHIWLKALFIAISGLTGVVACFMTPLFIVRTYVDKSKEYLVYTLILFFSSMLQLSIYINEYLKASAELAYRFKGNDALTVFIKFMIYQFSVPIMGRGVFENKHVVEINNIISQIILNVFGSSRFENTITAVPFILGLIISSSMIIICIKNKKLEYKLMLSAFLLVSIISTLASEHMSGGPRYTFVPCIIMISIFVSSINIENITKTLRSVGLYIVLMTIVFNLKEYRAITGMVYNTEYPLWRNEIEIRRLVGEAYPLKILPIGITMYLYEPRKGHP